MSYAATTEVSPEKTRAEIESLLMKSGAKEFASGWKDVEAIMQFSIHQRIVRFRLPLPQLSEDRFQRDPRYSWKKRSENVSKSAWEQARRARWRGLLLCIKAKLESVESGIESFDTAFLAQIVLPDGKTVEERVLPAIQEAYRTGIAPSVLMLTGGEK